MWMKRGYEKGIIAVSFTITSDTFNISKGMFTAINNIIYLFALY